MKKQIFALSMCFALSATTVLAAATSADIKTTATQTIVVPIKAQVMPAKKGMAVCPKAQSRDEIRKTMDDRIAKERASMYNSLQLTDEQKAKAEALDQKTRSGFKPLMSKVKNEKNRLDKLQKEKASAFSILKQKKSLKAAKKELKSYLDDSKKSFEAILTPEQKAKFEAMDAERKAKMKEFRKTRKRSGKSPLRDMSPPPCPKEQALTEKVVPCPYSTPAAK